MEFMYQKALLARLGRENRSGISPIIATLILIVIAIAAGVVVYAYVGNFVGNSTGNNGGSQSVISVDNYCGSASNKCSGSAYSIVIRNVGSTTIATGTAQVYFTDVTSGASGSSTCSIASAAAPGSTYTCSNSWPAGFAPSSGDSLTVKIVNPDGGSTTSNTKAIS